MEHEHGIHIAETQEHVQLFWSQLAGDHARAALRQVPRGRRGGGPNPIPQTQEEEERRRRKKQEADRKYRKKRRAEEEELRATNKSLKDKINNMEAELHNKLGKFEVEFMALKRNVGEMESKLMESHLTHQNSNPFFDFRSQGEQLGDNGISRMFYAANSGTILPETTSTATLDEMFSTMPPDQVFDQTTMELCRTGWWFYG